MLYWMSFSPYRICTYNHLQYYIHNLMQLPSPFPKGFPEYPSTLQKLHSLLSHTGISDQPLHFSDLPVKRMPSDAVPVHVLPDVPNQMPVQQRRLRLRPVHRNYTAQSLHRRRIAGIQFLSLPVQIQHPDLRPLQLPRRKRSGKMSAMDWTML